MTIVTGFRAYRSPAAPSGNRSARWRWRAAVETWKAALRPGLPAIFSRRRVVGHVDHVNDGIIRGWAWSPRQLQRRVVLDIVYDGIYLGKAFAGAYRDDLRHNGIGDGRHAFLFHLPDEVPHPIDPAKLVVATADRPRSILSFGPKRKFAKRHLPFEPGAAFGPFLASLAAREPDGIATTSGRRRRVEVMLSDDADLPVSAFVAHISRKYERSFAPSDGLDLLSWYLDAYATERGPKLVPLSQRDIARLNASDAEATSAGMTLAMEEIGCAPSDATYRWAVEACGRRFVDDCLVDVRQTAWLRTIAKGQEGCSYPLSQFMRIVCAETAVLQRFRSDSESDRTAIYLLTATMALRQPSLFAYIPQVWLADLLRPNGPLDDVMTRVFGRDHSIDVQTVRRRLDAASRPASRTRNFYGANRVLGGRAMASLPATVDVQLFGPFSRMMGLGESCRRIARAFAATGLTVNFVDYSVGLASPAICSDLTLGAPTTARLNVLHLNLEEIPEVLAYLPDVFSNAPTVAVPYWELNRPAPVHRLGLQTIDEVWVCSHFLDEVFSGHGPAVRWIGMSCDQAPVPDVEQRRAFRTNYAILEGRFAFLTTFDALSWAQRKNPLGVIAAFQEAFPGDEDVALVVKTHNLHAPFTMEQTFYLQEMQARCAKDPRIVFIDASLEPADQRTLLASSDCLVSLHRAEGLGFDVLDAIALGTSVVATDYSGVKDCCTPETAWTVDADLVPVAPHQYSFVEEGHLWAAPRHDKAVEALRAVYADPQARRQKIERGRRLVEERATLDALATRLAQSAARWIA